MSRLLKLTALIEAATGLALIAVLAIVVRLLLGAEISGASMPLGRCRGTPGVSPAYDGSPRNEAMDSNQMSNS